MFSKNGGVAGWVAYPFSLLFEWVGPIVELTGYAVVIWGFSAGWISVDRKALQGEVKHIPSRDEIAPTLNEQLIVELYSK